LCRVVLGRARLDRTALCRAGSSQACRKLSVHQRHTQLMAAAPTSGPVFSDQDWPMAGPIQRARASARICRFTGSAKICSPAPRPRPQAPSPPPPPPSLPPPPMSPSHRRARAAAAPVRSRRGGRRCERDGVRGVCGVLRAARGACGARSAARGACGARSAAGPRRTGRCASRRTSPGSPRTAAPAPPARTPAAPRPPPPPPRPPPRSPPSPQPPRPGARSPSRPPRGPRGPPVPACREARDAAEAARGQRRRVVAAGLGRAGPVPTGNY
jgi:hypothetical protein